MPLLQAVKKHLAGTFALTAAVLLAACSSVETRVEEARLIPRNFELNLRDNTPGSNVEFGKIKLEYVQLVGWKNLAAEEKINQSIRHIVGMDNPYDGSEDLTLLVKKAELGKDALHFMVQGSYYKHGAANGQERIHSTYFSLESGEPIRLSDVLQSGFEPVVNAQVKTWLAAQSYDNLFDGITDDQCFYHDANTLYLCFSEYQVAPGAAGIVIVPIAKSSLSGLIKPSGLLAK